MTQIDDVVTTDDRNEVVLDSRKRKVTTRPSNWRLITEHINEYGLDSSIQAYAVELSIYSKPALRLNIKRWKADLLANKSDASILDHKREPAYGIEIDLQVYQDLQVRMLQGLPIDATVARQCLLNRLAIAGKMSLLKGHGTKITVALLF